MKLPQLLFCCILLLSNWLSAQSNWQAATLTDRNGRSVQAQVDYRKWGFHFDYLRVRDREGEPVRRVKVADLISFTVGGRRYEIREVTVTTAPRVVKELVSREEAPTETLAAPLLVLREGKYDLYEYNDRASNNHYFVGTPDGQLQLLNYGLYAQTGTNSYTRYETDNSFRGQLGRMFSDCPGLVPLLKTLRYDRASLTRAFDRHVECSRSAHSYMLIPEGNVWSVGPELGVSMISPNPGNLAELRSYNPRRTLDVTFGAHVSTRFSGATGAVSLRAAVLYQQYSLNSTRRENLVSENSFRDFTNSIEEQAVKIQFGPKVTIIRSRYPVFLEGYLEYAQVLRYSEVRSEQLVLLGNQGDERSVGNFQENFGRYSIAAGLGVNIGNWAVSARGNIGRSRFRKETPGNGILEDYDLVIYRAGLFASYSFTL